MTPKHFVAQLAEFSAPSVFNPWGERCSVHDRPDAAASNGLVKVTQPLHFRGEDTKP